jgi:CubicO group peptidase (beta-lactamase class C family)
MKRHLQTALCIALVLASFSVWGQGFPTAKPEEVGLSSERLERVTAAMQQHIDDKELAGVVGLIARRGKIAYFETFGMRDREAGKPMEKDTLFRIYSMTKPITSVAVMMLYEEGRFYLGDEVSKYIPALGDLDALVVETDPETGEKSFLLKPSEKGMTVQDLLRHTSGLTYGIFGSTKVDEMYRKAGFLDGDGTIEDMVEKLGILPLMHEPGTEWHYSVSTDVLGRLVEVLSGVSFDKFLEERIFKPLGMNDTAFYVPREKVDRLAAMYHIDKEKKLQASNEDDAPDSKPTFLSGGGGLFSTAGDYLKFCQMMLNGGELNGVRILSRKTVELMTRDHMLGISAAVDDADGQGFGLGFAVCLDPARKSAADSVGTYHWGGAAHTRFWIDPEEEFIGVFMVHIFNPQMDYQEQFRILSYQAIDD